MAAYGVACAAWRNGAHDDGGICRKTTPLVCCGRWLPYLPRASAPISAYPFMLARSRAAACNLPYARQRAWQRHIFARAASRRARSASSTAYVAYGSTHKRAAAPQASRAAISARRAAGARAARRRLCGTLTARNNSYRCAALARAAAVARHAKTISYNACSAARAARAPRGERRRRVPRRCARLRASRRDRGAAGTISVVSSADAPLPYIARHGGGGANITPRSRQLRHRRTYGAPDIGEISVAWRA